MMETGIRQLCILSIICGTVLSITPEGGTKRVTELVCTAVLVMEAVCAVGEMDYGYYALETAKLHDIESEFLRSAENTADRMNRLVIEKDYEAYIMDKAEELNIEISAVNVELQWEPEGLWIPWEAEITATCGEEEKNRLSSIIREDFGIPLERQHWADE